ncbi:MAG: oxidoreductase [Lentisphaerae bacterium RIFOXYC12_FULL_60_16]|nr:MAG: oxidoreductase [Lentisphaerae bacterium RIFOXYC12_FULL_60_16]OGV84118.1 MAG: oxidoreductase [Lentisphaerae bacterium RIFOXYB12_FULL_60_10]
MKDLRVGVIGSGGRGGLAVHAHRPGKGSVVAACCDSNPAVLEWNRERYGKDVFTTKDYRKLLDQDLDAVFVTTPDFLHEEHALAALTKGLGVYLEKPMAITIKGCDRILAAARRERARLFVGHNMRYMTVFIRMKQIIDRGDIGEVKSAWCRHFVSYGGDAYFRDWHSERRYTTGLLLQKGAHDIDMIHWLTGAYSKRVSAFGNLAVYGRCKRRPKSEKGIATFNAAHWPPLKQQGFSPVINVEDQNVMIMELERGILGSYLQCHFTPDSCRNYTIIGTEGRIENVGDGPESPIFLWNRRKDGYEMIGDQVFRGGTVSASGHGGADEVIVQEFLQYVRKGGKTTATPEAARMAVAAGCQATESLRNGGKPMHVPALKE